MKREQQSWSLCWAICGAFLPGTLLCKDPAQRAVLSRLTRWATSRPNQLLTWAGGRAIFGALHEDVWEFQNKASGLCRGDAAKLLTDMFPASDRQSPLQVGAQKGGCPHCVQ